MKYRIALWASAGFLVAGFWALYFAGAGKNNPIEPMVHILTCLTCPVALFSSYPLSLYSVLLANAATYALVGLIVETMRRQLKHTH
jgi:hypothetical protein